MKYQLIAVSLAVPITARSFALGNTADNTLFVRNAHPNYRAVATRSAPYYFHSDIWSRNQDSFYLYARNFNSVLQKRVKGSLTREPVSEHPLSNNAAPAPPPSSPASSSGSLPAGARAPPPSRQGSTSSTSSGNSDGFVNLPPPPPNANANANHNHNPPRPGRRSPSRSSNSDGFVPMSSQFGGAPKSVNGGYETGDGKQTLAGKAVDQASAGARIVKDKPSSLINPVGTLGGVAATIGHATGSPLAAGLGTGIQTLATAGSNYFGGSDAVKDHNAAVTGGPADKAKPKTKRDIGLDMDLDTLVGLYLARRNAVIRQERLYGRWARPEPDPTAEAEAEAESYWFDEF
ncbi:hypothetical protein MMC10_005796 [Thelotrema lepadinum]|nr:hypothetical protein [Thelotrema lepadinum]